MLWIVGLFGVYVLALLGIAWISLHPFRIPTYLSPGAFDIPQQDVEFESDGNLLRGWWVEAPDSTAVVICVHGYMMNKCELTPVAAHLWKRGVSCMVFDHRAHGTSEGSECGFGYLERVDVIAAVAEARLRKPGAKIGLIGSSMGSAAIALALRDDPLLADVVILDSCYARLTSAILGWWRFLGGKWLMALLSPTTVIAAPFAGFNPFPVDISEALKACNDTPILFLHGDRDNLALPSEAQRNFDAYPGPKEIVWFERCGHSEGRWEQPEKYSAVVDGFLEANGFLTMWNAVDKKLS